MATLGAFAITGSWTKIYDGHISGAFSGAIQGLDSNAIYVRVTDGNLKPTDQSGFMLYNTIEPFAVAATQAVWARAADGSGNVIMG